MASCVFKRNEIKKIAREILAMRPDIIAMEGPLGAGKTTLTKALAKEMGIEDEVLSPTFILHEEYPGLDHIDAWRVEDFEEIERLGLFEMINNKHLIIIEWADKFAEEVVYLANKKLSNEDTKIVWVKIEYGEKENERIILIDLISN